MQVSLFVLLTGEFPFARPADEGASNVVRMQRMFARIIKGDVQPMPHVRPFRFRLRPLLLHLPFLALLMYAHISKRDVQPMPHSRIFFTPCLHLAFQLLQHLSSARVSMPFCDRRR